MYQPVRQPGNPKLHPPAYEGIPPFMMALYVSMIVFFRRNMGHRLMHPMHFAGPVAFHIIMGYLSLHATNVPSYVHESGAVMIVYAISMGLLSGYREREGLLLAFKHPALHSMAIGESLLKPICRKLHLRAQALDGIEPLLALVSGIYMISNLYWYLLGWWFVLGAISVIYVDIVVKAHSDNAVFDLRDSHAQSHALMEVEKMTKGSNKDTMSASGKVARLSPEVEQLKPGQTTMRRVRDS